MVEPEVAGSVMLALRTRLRRWWAGPRTRRFLRDRASVAALAAVLVLVGLAVVAPLVAPQDPNAQHLRETLAGPTWGHLLGTDRFGRDTLSRVIVASRVTMVAAAEGLSVALIIGVPIGLLAGYVGGAVDGTASRLAEAFLAMPPLILALGIIAVLGRGLTNAMVAIGIVLAPRFFRVARGAAQDVRHEVYIEAARADGSSTGRLLLRHVLPNASGPLLVQASLGVGTVIASEAGLSFLGLGVQAPSASWGSMIRDGFDVVNHTTAPILPPCVMVIVTIAAFFALGDRIRDALGRSPGRAE